MIRIKHIGTLLLIALTSCLTDQISEEANSSTQLPNDRPWWLEKYDSLMQDSVIMDRTFQDSVFKNIEGVWECVLDENNMNGVTSIPKYEGLLIQNGQYIWFDYPCGCSDINWMRDMYFKNDSAFLVSQDKTIIDKRIEWHGDTLALLEENGFSNYYLRLDYQQGIVDSLKANRYHPDCIKGEWELVRISEDGFEGHVIHDELLAHAPRVIDFSEDKFYFEGHYLNSSLDSTLKFEVLKLHRSYYYYDKSDTQTLELKDTKKHNELYWHYEYRPKLKNAH